MGYIGHPPDRVNVTGIAEEIFPTQGWSNYADSKKIMRIVQETLTNTRKHAQAQTVRVLLTREQTGEYLLLIEDDGIGFEGASKQGRPGEHIGLSIMEERARRLGGNLRIESEVGEGTRVELSYRPQADRRKADRRWIV